VDKNLTDGEAQGLEASVTVAPMAWWRVTTTSTTTHLDLTAHGADLNRGVWFDGATPRHQLGVRAQLDLGTKVDLDAFVRHATAIRRLPSVSSGAGIPDYAELDVRVAWRPVPAIEGAIVGQSLLHDHHLEFASTGSRAEIQRAVYASLT